MGPSECKRRIIPAAWYGFLSQKRAQRQLRYGNNRLIEAQGRFLTTSHGGASKFLLCLGKEGIKKARTRSEAAHVRLVGGFGISAAPDRKAGKGSLSCQDIRWSAGLDEQVLWMERGHSMENSAFGGERPVGNVFRNKSIRSSEL